MMLNLEKNFEKQGYWDDMYFSSLGIYFQTIIVELGEEVGTAEIDDKAFVSEKLIPIPKNWKWHRIKDVVEFSRNLNIETQLPPNTIINYIDIDAIDNIKYRVREIKQRIVSELSSRARRVLHKDYVLYSLVRPYLNNIAIINEERNNFIGSTGFAVFKGTLAYNEFLKFYLLSNFIRQRYLSMLSGFNSPSITHEQFANTPIPIPSLKEQKRILDFLNALERNEIRKVGDHLPAGVESKVIELHRTQINVRILERELNLQQSYIQQLRHAILQEAVQGKLTKQDPNDEPAAQLLQCIKAEKQKLIAAGKLKKESELPPITEEEIPFELPKAWVWCRFGEVALNVDYGTSEKASLTGDVPILRMGNVQDGEIIFSNLKYVQKNIKDLPRLYLKNKDLIFNRTNSFELVGKCGIFYGADDEYTLASYLIRVGVPHNLVLIEFVSTYINSTICRQTQIEPQITQQTGQANFSGSKLKMILIPLPSLSEQHRIVAKAQQLMLQLRQIEHRVEESRKQAGQLLQAVLKEAFAGEEVVLNEIEYG